MKNLLLVLFLVVGFVSSAQTESVESNNVQTVPTEYNRNALSVLVLENNNGFTSTFKQAAESIIIIDKYDDNNVDTRTVNSIANANAISASLSNQKIGNQIISKWFSRNDTTGEFNMSVIHERGMYNATNQEVIQASASKLGIAKLKDAGESLIARSYIMVLEFYGIESMQMVYNKRDLAKRAAAEILDKNYQPVRRVKNGWVGNVRGYMYKISTNDSLADVFYNDMWIYEDDDEATRLQKKQKFEEATFSLEFVTQVSANADGTQYNPGHPMSASVQLSKTGLFQKMINSGLNNCLAKSEKSIENFKVKSPIYKTNPISAQIGKKEGLKADHRYQVVEFQQNGKGETVTRRKGVVRVKKATDNRKVATGEADKLSTFYQIAGTGLESGMLLYQKNDVGINVVGGMSIGEIAGGWGKVEFNLARMSSSMFDLGITQLHLFGTLGFDNGDYDVLNEGKVYDMSFIRWQVGISKGFYFARRFQLAPFIAFGAESGSNTQMNQDFGWNSNDFIGTNYFNPGINASVNLTSFLQFYSSVNYIMPLWYTYTKQRHIWDVDKYNNKTYTQFFNNRKGLSIDLGVRLEF